MLADVPLSNLCRPVGTAVVEKDVVPVRVRLPEYAFNTFAEILFCIEEWRNEANARDI
jgi:hypothetical protein